MSNSIYKYLDINSSYRNRNMYPNPTDFALPVSYIAGTNGNAFTAVDPIVGAVPFETGVTVGVSTPTNINLAASSSTINNFYVDNILQIGTEYRTIVSYSAVGNVAIVSSPFSAAPAAGTTYYIRDGIPTYSGSVAALGTTQNVVNLGVGASSSDGAYVGYYIYFLTGVNSGTTRMITSYTGSTRLATLSLALPSIPGIGDNFDICSFTKDNFCPMLYSGSLTNQPVCYSIELLYLLLPNVNIKSGYGGTFSKYPYFYLKLYNEGNNHANKVLYSNNPNSQSALFKVPIGLNLNSETFFTLKDSKCIQVVKFRPTDNLRFTLTFPNGEPVIFTQSDNFSPLSPNPFLQISATFAIRRIDGGDGS